MQESNPLPPLVRLILIGTGLFIAGALFSFGYSYRPLHGAKNWQISELESRLSERNQENLALSDEVARLKAEKSNQLDPEDYLRIEQELADTRQSLQDAERVLNKEERKRKEATTSASRWRTRYETLRDETAGRSMPAAPAPAPPPEPEVNELPSFTPGNTFEPLSDVSPTP